MKKRRRYCSSSPSSSSSLSSDCSSDCQARRKRSSTSRRRLRRRSSSSSSRRELSPLPKRKKAHNNRKRKKKPPSRSRRRKTDEKGHSRGRRSRGRSPSSSSCSLCSSSSGERGRSRRDEDRVEMIQEYGDEGFPSDSLGDDRCAAEFHQVLGCTRTASRESESNGGIGDSVPRLNIALTPPPSEAHDHELILRHKALENLIKFRKDKTLRLASSSLGGAGNNDNKRPGGTVETILNREAVDSVKEHASSFVRMNHDPALSARTPCIDSRMLVGDNTRSMAEGGSLLATRSHPDFNSQKLSGDCKEKQCMGPGNPKKKSIQNELHSKSDTGEKSSGFDAAGPSTVANQETIANNNDIRRGINENSGLESKTMTVMRGGELVQVNYKVYIPKAASFARRPLKR